MVAALDGHLTYLEESGELARRRHARARDEIEAIALTALRSRFAHLHGDRRLDALATRVLDAELDPYTAADELLTAVG